MHKIFYISKINIFYTQATYNYGMHACLHHAATKGENKKFWLISTRVASLTPLLFQNFKFKPNFENNFYPR